MKNLTIIAAIGKNNELGLNNDLIWKFKEDMNFFKENTMGKSIVMGRKTLESLPNILPGRKHLVISKKMDEDLNGEVKVFSSIENFIEYALSQDEEIMVIGGASIYKELLPYSDRMLLTEVDDEHLADAFFPEFNKDEWESTILSEQEEQGIKYKHLEYKRKKTK